MAAPKGNKFAYQNPYSGRPTTWTADIIEKEAELLIEWCQRDDAIVLREFAPLRGYAHGYMYRWADTKEPSYNEVFCEAFDFARSIVGARREKLCIDKSAQRDLPMYTKELDNFEREREEFKSKLKQKESKSQAESLAELAVLASASQQRVADKIQATSVAKRKAAKKAKSPAKRKAAVKTTKAAPKQKKV